MNKAPYKPTVAAPFLAFALVWATATAAPPPSQPKPDCGEKKVTIEELNKIASSSDVKNMQDFLERIPAGTLQTFTFVTNSLSLHRGNETGAGKVSPLWPRVIRTSTDGKIALSFVCDPMNPTYGKVETLFFDDAGRQVKAVEWDFGPALKPNPPSDRVHQDPISCVSCHGGTQLQGKADLKYIWPEYFFWGDCVEDRGISMYGSSDDLMVLNAFRERIHSSRGKTPKGCDREKDRAAMAREVKNFARFREAQKDNACFNTLPWRRAEPGEKAGPESPQALYPYQANYTQAKLQDRPNLRLTSVFSQLRAKQMLAQFKRSPHRYNAIKYALLFENSCVKPGDRKRKAEEMGFPTPALSDGQSASQSVLATQPLLYGFSRSIGMQDRDWNLEFRSDDPTYNGGLGSIFGFLTGEILKDVAEENPAIAAASRGQELDHFTDPYHAYDCVNETARSVKPLGHQVFAPNADAPDKPQREFCDALAAQIAAAPAPSADGILAETCRDLPDDVTADAQALAAQAKAAVALANAASIARGRELVKSTSRGRCVSCHSVGAPGHRVPTDLRFVPDESAPAGEIAESLAILEARMKEGFRERLNSQLTVKKKMPPTANDLTQSEREDIENYIGSLAP